MSTQPAPLLSCPKCGNGEFSVNDLPCACNFCSYVMDCSCPFCGEEPDWKRPNENNPRIVGCINSSCCMRQLGYVSEEIWNRRAPALADGRTACVRVMSEAEWTQKFAEWTDHPDHKCQWPRDGWLACARALGAVR